MDRNFGRDEEELIAALDVSGYTMLVICLSLTYVSLCSKELILPFTLFAKTFLEAAVESSSSDSETGEEEDNHLLILQATENVFGVSNSGVLSKRIWNVVNLLRDICKT